MLKREVIDNKSNFNLKSNIINALIEKFGKEAQVIQSLEEMSELQKELLKNINRGKENRAEILEELADVLFMMDQLKVIYEFSDEEVQNELETKIAKATTLL